MDSDPTTELVGEVLRLVQTLGVVPWWVVPLAAVLVAVVVVVLRHVSIGALFRRWQKATEGAPPSDPERQIGAAPPMDVPPGGMPVPGPGDRWKVGDP